MEQYTLLEKTKTYAAVKQKAAAKQIIASYCSVVDFLKNINEEINSKELWLDKLRSVPKDILASFDDEKVFDILNFEVQTEEEALIEELEKTAKIYKKQILAVPIEERILVILTLFSNKDRQEIAEIFNSQVTPPNERWTRIKGLLEDDILELIDNQDSIKRMEMSVRTYDRKFKKGIQHFTKINEYIFEFYPREMLRSCQVQKMGCSSYYDVGN